MQLLIKTTPEPMIFWKSFMVDGSFPLKGINQGYTLQISPLISWVGNHLKISQFFVSDYIIILLWGWQQKYKVLQKILFCAHSAVLLVIIITLSWRSLVINQKLVQDPANIGYQRHFVHRLLAVSDQIHFTLRNINIVEKHSIMVSRMQQGTDIIPFI